MAEELRLALALILATATAYALTPVAIHAAARFDFYDKPQGYKGHVAATPYLGGSAVLGAFLIVLLLVAGDPARTLPIAAGASVLWAVGTLDDRRTVAPGLRVTIEIGLAAMLSATGLGWDLGAGAGLDLAATCLWVVAVVNAINLFDNMDGASSTITFVVSAAIAALGVIEGDIWLASAGAALAGACLGFLPYNLARPNARIFLGDGGSMPIGFALAALVMTGVSDAVPAWQALVLGLMLVAIPALDTTLVIISRRRKGISILTGGRDHLTHRTQRRFTTARAVALTLGALQALVAAVALVALNGRSIVIVVLTAALLAAAGGIIVYLEREEDRLHYAGELSVSEEAVAKAQLRRARRPDPYTVGDVALVVFALGAGISPLFFGYYATALWVPIGLGLVVIAAMGTIRRPPTLARRGWLVLAAVVGLGLVSVLSSTWAQSADQATIAGNRWLVLAAVLGLALVLVRSARRELIATGALAAGIMLVAAIVTARMLGSDGGDVFLAGRLNEPLGYVNAEATVFLMGLWLCFAAVERHRSWLAGPALAAATWLGGLTLMSQSRGAAIAAIASAVIVVAVVPGRQRRAFALLVLGVGLLVARAALLDVYTAAQATGEAPAAHLVRHAAVVLLLCSAFAGLVWGLATYAHDRLLDDGARGLVRTTGRAILIGAAAIALIGAVAGAGRIDTTLHTQWTAFTRLDPTGAAAPSPDAGSRLVSGAGNRYDYWRVAWHAFTQHAGDGLGAGNFDEAWFVERRVAEDVTNPHSLELQILSELGLIGAVLLAAFLAGLAVGVARIRRVAVPGTASGGVAVAAVGVVIAWLVHTSVDWQHLIPGVTAIAFIMLSVLLRHRPQVDGAAAPSRLLANRPAQVVVAIGVGALVAITGALLTRQGLADHYRNEAVAAVTSSPTRAIEQADRSLRLDGDAVPTYYAKAAALARLNRGDAAEQVLLEATRREPRDSVTWALLGDLATRRGLESDARRYYVHALALDPRDPGLQALAHPRAGTTSP